ncbi:MAG TPA: DMT family transporter [Thermoanaerobaculia bacterium]|nr:DMT family transporter [Thermoanaerobaculia bacterium]
MPPAPARRALAVSFALLTVAIWGVNYPAMKIALREMHPLAYTGWRFVLAASLLLAEASWRGGPALPARGQRGLAALLALTGVGLYQVFFAWGVAGTSGFAAALLNATSPLFSLLFVVLLGQERWTPMTALGSVVAYGGVALFVATSHAAEGGTLAGNVLCLLSAATWAVYTVAATRLPGRLTPFQSQFATFVGGSVPLLLYCAPAMARQDYAAVSAGTWLILALSAVLPLVLAFRLWTYALQVLGVGETTSFGFLVPVLAGLSSALWTGEIFGLEKLLSAGVVLVGLFLTKAGGLREGGGAPGR